MNELRSLHHGVCAQTKRAEREGPFFQTRSPIWCQFWEAAPVLLNNNPSDWHSKIGTEAGLPVLNISEEKENTKNKQHSGNWFLFDPKINEPQSCGVVESLTKETFPIIRYKKGKPYIKKRTTDFEKGGVTEGRRDNRMWRKGGKWPILKDVKSLLHLCQASLAAAQIYRLFILHQEVPRKQKNHIQVNDRRHTTGDMTSEWSIKCPLGWMLLEKERERETARDRKKY